VARQAAAQDDQSELTFPVGGLELAHPSLMGRPDTSPVAENVRFFEPLTGRGRGGSRPGIDKFIASQVSGENVIQHITSIVTVDGEMLDYSFDGPNQEFPGIYAGIGFIDFGISLIPPFDFPDIPDDGNGETFEGASGYSPKPADKKTRIILSVDPQVLTISSVSLLTVQLLDGDGNPYNLPDKTYLLYTDPPGEVGDGNEATALSSPQVTLSATSPKKIYYRATVKSLTGSIVARSNTVWVRFEKGVTTVAWNNPSAITAGDALSATQLNAIAGVAGIGTIDGTYVYTPPAGTILSVGADQPLSVQFTPDNTESYTTPAAKVVLITVLPSGGGAGPTLQGNGTVASHSGGGTAVSGDIVDGEMTTIGSGVTATKDPGTDTLPDDSDTPVTVPSDSLTVSDEIGVGSSASWRYHYGTAAWYYYLAPF
jgi:hypothetical protein